jgi:hypothetical protein
MIKSFKKRGIKDRIPPKQRREFRFPDRHFPLYFCAALYASTRSKNIYDAEHSPTQTVRCHDLSAASVRQRTVDLQNVCNTAGGSFF